MNYFNIFFANTFLLFFINVYAQDSSFFKGGDYQYKDSMIVIGDDSIGIIYGTNYTLNLRFWSRYLFQEIEYSKTYSKRPRPISNLYSFSGEDYLAGLPDTSQWKSFNNKKLGIFMKYLPGLEVMVRYDSIQNLNSVEFGFSDLDTLGVNRFVPWIRISHTSKDFFQEVSSHGWSSDYKGEWYLINGDIYDVSYIEGKNWKCLKGLETVIFYENNQLGYGDKLKFLAMIERKNKPSLLFELLINYYDDRFISEKELYTMLSSIILYK